MKIYLFVLFKLVGHATKELLVISIGERIAKGEESFDFRITFEVEREVGVYAPGLEVFLFMLEE